MNTRDFPVLVIGAGISGIGAGYYLGASGISYTIRNYSAYPEGRGLGA